MPARSGIGRLADRTGSSGGQAIARQFGAPCLRIIGPPSRIIAPPYNSAKRVWF